MTTAEKSSIFALRVALGALYLYAGVSKIIAPAWSAAGYLKNASTLTGFYHWLGSPAVLPTVNVLNEWGLFLLGLSLVLGLFVRLSSAAGVALMLLYYMPILKFPFVGSNGFLVDEHVVFAIVLTHFMVVRAGRVWGLDGVLSKLSAHKLYSKLLEWLG